MAKVNKVKELPDFDNCPQCNRELFGFPVDNVHVEFQPLKLNGWYDVEASYCENCDETFVLIPKKNVAFAIDGKYEPT